jgi:hypothetical protein
MFKDVNEALNSFYCMVLSGPKYFGRQCDINDIQL